MAYDGGYENEPRKLEYLRTSPSIMSTDFIGAVEEDGVFSFAYRFETNQGNFIAARWMALYQDSLNPTEEWLAKNDISKWTPENREFQKAWLAMQKEELLRVRRDLLKDTLNYFREMAKGDAKEGLRHLLLEGYDGESDWNAVGKDFPKSKVHEKVWKSVKL